MNESQQHMPLEKRVMGAILEGRVHMRPRWRFVLSGLLAALGALTLLLTLFYIVSFGIFMLRQSGALFVPVFGMRGLAAFFAALPLVLVVLLVLFIITLEILVRRYRVGYRTPLMVSALAIFAIVLLGGYGLDRTRIHDELLRAARDAGLPQPFDELYQSGGQPVPGIYHGIITSFSSGGFVLVDENGAGTTTVLVDPQTRLPFGADFAVGEEVVVFGDKVATGTVQAFGVRDFGD